MQHGVVYRPGAGRGKCPVAPRAMGADALLLPVTRMAQFIRQFRQALWQALDHDVLNTAKASAYSGMLMLFPALVVLTTVMALVPEGPSLVGEVRSALEQLMPADSMSLLQAALATRRIHSAQLIFSAASLSVFAGLGLMLSMMEGFRRAYRLPRGDWGFWQRRLRALLLVPIVLVPLTLATLVLAKVAVGRVATSKKSGVFRWLLRASSPVSTVPTSMVALTVDLVTSVSL